MAKNSSNQNSTKNQITISPNPSKGIFTIKGEFNPKEKVTITVNDLMGRTVYTNTIANFNIAGEELDLKNQSVGTYIVSLVQGTTKITHTIIKE
jgi:hypothetical protein